MRNHSRKQIAARKKSYRSNSLFDLHGGLNDDQTGTTHSCLSPDQDYMKVFRITMAAACLFLAFSDFVVCSGNGGDDAGSADEFDELFIDDDFDEACDDTFEVDLVEVLVVIFDERLNEGSFIVLGRGENFGKNSTDKVSRSGRCDVTRNNEGRPLAFMRSHLCELISGESDTVFSILINSRSFKKCSFVVYFFRIQSILDFKKIRVGLY